MLLPLATGSISSDNLLAFDVTGSKACKITGNDIVTIENEESCLRQHCNFNFKTLSTELCHFLLNW